MARMETTRRPEVTHGTREDTRYTVGAGIGAGILAALVMGLFLMIVFAARGQGFWSPVVLIGAVFLGEDALVWQFWSGVLGMGIHLVLGAIFGVLFAAMVRGVRAYAVRVAAGLAYGAVLFLVMTYLVLPWANPYLALAIEPGWFFLAHLLFGLVLPLAMPRRAIAPRPGGRELYTNP